MNLHLGNHKYKWHWFKYKCYIYETKNRIAIGSNGNVISRCLNLDRTKITWNRTCKQSAFALKLSDVRYWQTDIWYSIVENKYLISDISLLGILPVTRNTPNHALSLPHIRYQCANPLQYLMCFRHYIQNIFIPVYSYKLSRH